ncbi:MAG: SGNH/GDSL hydrolase family protein [bacterium]
MMRKMMMVFGLLSCSVVAQTVDMLEGKRVAVLGDSITQGGTYVSLVSYYLDRLYPTKNFDIYSLGLSSETVSGLSEESHIKHGFARPCLFERLDRLLAKVKPEVVIACYGMNCGIYQPLDDARFNAFKSGVSNLIERCTKAGAKTVILVTPPLYDFKKDDPMAFYDGVLGSYGAWEQTIKIPGVYIIDLHSVMRKVRNEKPDAVISNDRIHPGEEGHLLMAKTILKGLGVIVPEEDLATIKKDPLFNLVAKRRAMRANGWMPYIGYSRGKTFRADSVEKTEADAKKLQDEINALRRK